MRVVSFCFTGHHFLGSSVTARAPNSRKTANGEIAHFTCTLKYNLSSAEITWQKQGHNLRDGSSGVVIISWNNGTILESHLLVAVMDDDERRGTYTCVGTDEDGQSRRSFVIQGELSFKQYLIREYFQLSVENNSRLLLLCFTSNHYGSGTSGTSGSFQPTYKSHFLHCVTQVNKTVFIWCRK